MHIRIYAEYYDYVYDSLKSLNKNWVDPHLAGLLLKVSAAVRNTGAPW